MRAVFAVTLMALAVAIVGCGHRKPKEAKTSAPASAPAAESGRCDVKGFAYATPAPGAIREAGAP